MSLFEVTIEVVQRCPNRCIYCSSWSDINKTMTMDFETICGIVDDAVELGAKQINLSGGEPLLREDIVLITDYIKKRDLKIRLYSSGIHFDGEYHPIPIELLDSLKDRVDTLVFNYEAASSEIYSQIMGTVPEYLLLLDETIKNAIKLGINVETHLVPIKCNYRMIPQTLEKVYSLGVSKVSILRLVPQGRTMENVETTVLSDYEEAELKEMLKVLSYQYGEKLRLGKPYRSERYSTCWTGTIRLAVRYDGFVFPCGAFKDGMMVFKGFTPDNVHDRRLADIYRSSSYLARIREDLDCYYRGAVADPCFGQYCRSIQKL